MLSLLSHPGSFVILRLAKRAEGSQDARKLAETRFQQMSRILSSFAVLRRLTALRFAPSAALDDI
jgi:hypothetical protein